MKDIKEAYFEAAYNKVKTIKDILGGYSDKELELNDIIDYIVINACSIYSNYDDEEIVEEVKKDKDRDVIITKKDDSKELLVQDFNRDEWRIYLPKTKLCMEIIRAYHGNIQDFSSETWEDIMYYGISTSCATMLNKFEEEGKIDIIKNH